MKMTDALIAEFKQEAATTRRVLERVPESKFSWAPHPKSMTLGVLALHLAGAPGRLAGLIQQPVGEAPASKPAEATSVADILAAFDASVATATKVLAAWTDADLEANWKWVREGKTIIETTRIGVVRSLLFNHTYHHRGQLTVYLRLLDAPVPSVYGPSADENPFA